MTSSRRSVTVPRYNILNKYKIIFDVVQYSYNINENVCYLVCLANALKCSTDFDHANVYDKTLTCICWCKAYARALLSKLRVTYFDSGDKLMHV